MIDYLLIFKICNVGQLSPWSPYQLNLKFDEMSNDVVSDQRTGDPILIQISSIISPLKMTL